MDSSDKICFTINGDKYSVGCDVSSTTTLLIFIRESGLYGTKYMCLAGGCGACMVSVVKSPGQLPQSINSCLVSVTSCSNWEIKTIEGIGNRSIGYHPLQKMLAECGGSQCGYCSPGMIMNMYNVLQTPHTMKEIERSLGSNICRCTGYRSILNAFKCFASDAPNPSTLEMEDLSICGKSNQCCSSKSDQCCSSKSDQSGWCMVSKNEAQDKVLHIKLKDNVDWYRVNYLSDVFDLWEKHGLESYMLVFGNTAKGVIPIVKNADCIMDISQVVELKVWEEDQNMVFGAGFTLAELMTKCRTLAQRDGFGYFDEMIKHFDEVAHVSVRNLGTLGGNLMIKKQSPGFQSDPYLFLETCGGQVTIMLPCGEKRILSMQSFLKEDMKGKIILNIIFPPLNDTYKLRTYKIMPRSQSVHALINAGFCFKLDENNIVEECRITYGALSAHFTRAFRTERYLVGKNLFDNDTLKGALSSLNNEMVIEDHLTEPKPEYRRILALGLFYKCCLSLCPDENISDYYRSGAQKHRETRPVSEGYQVYQTNPELWPITKPIPKTDGLIQCAGEARYTDDTPMMPNELFVAFVLAKVALGTIQKIDPSRALSLPGVVAFLSAKDIPGKNSFIPAPNSYNLADEELFCDGKVKFFDQPIGVIVCETQAMANYASTKVDVTYDKGEKPVIDIKEAKKDPKRVSVFQSVKAKSKGDDVYKVIKGSNTIYGQYHATMETLVCVAHPTEEGLKLYATTQWLDLMHQGTSRALGVQQNKIDVVCRRIGGGLGIKLGRANQVAVAAALVAHVLNRPCRFVTPLAVNMRAMGKRMPCSRDFEVGVNRDGVIQYVNCDLYGDNGYVINEPLLALGMDVYYNCYNKDLWNYTAHNVITDTPSNTWCRSPGTLENIAMAEFMMEGIASVMKMDSLKVRLANLGENCRDVILAMVNTLKSNSDYENRKIAVEKFNKENRWTKRGLRFSLLRWEPVGFMNLDVTVSVCADDGSVVITHGGVEMGQGINTKAIQTASYILKLPIDKIQVKGNDTTIAPNCSPSGGSITSQNVGIGVRRCCEDLLKRLEPIKSQMDNPTWVELIKKAYESQVQLKSCGYTTSADILHYDICGAAMCEVEIDVLTGEYQILKTEMIVDCGQSISPEVDCGQVEGAFLMGAGYWTCENLIYNPTNGEIVTDSTWMYWTSQACDIAHQSIIRFQKNSYSDDIVYGAKGTGEPATCLSVVVYFALYEAVLAARRDCGLPDDEWYQIDGPMCMDKICLGTETKPEYFKYN